MPRKDPITGKLKWYKSEGAVAVYSALISILIGMAVGAGMYLLALTTTVLVLICMETAHFIHPHREENDHEEE